MSNETKPAPDRKHLTIEVKALWFSMPSGREIPVPGQHGGNVSMVNGITAGKSPRGVFEITFEPHLRRHRVVFTSVNGPQASKTFCIPESWCTYEPVE